MLTLPSLPGAARSISAALPILACVVALLCAGGCEKKSTTDTVPIGKGSPTQSTLVIGHYGSLTGAEATFGISTDNGIKLAVKEANAAGGVSIGGVKHLVKLVSEDTEGKPDKAGTVVTKLITKDKVVAVLGEVASSVSLQGAPVCQQYGIPMITPSSTNPAVTQVGDHIFRVCFIDPFQGSAAATFATGDLKLTKAAILFDQAAAYSVGLKDEFKKAFIAKGGTIVSEQAYSKGGADFNAQLTKIREGNPELIFIPGYYSDVANIALQARKLGMKVPLLGGDGWDSDELGKNAGEAIEGSFYTNHYAPDSPSPEIVDFVAKYKTDFGGVPDGLAALGYDAARILFQALETAGTTDSTKLRDAIAATKAFPGVTGSITINKDRDAVKPIVVVERKGGAWVFRAKIDPQ
jgi:branched-chain amino acid transport system substrate-binding protein